MNPVEETDPEAPSPPKGKRRKVVIDYIVDKTRRLTTFHKRKEGLLKKAYELSTLTGSEILLLIASETGQVYTFATPKFQPLITRPPGKTFIENCLNTPDSAVEAMPAPPQAKKHM